MKNKTTVVNVRRDEYDVYIGRANKSIGEPESIFHNPFPISKVHTREEVIRMYEWHILKLMDESKEFAEELLKLKYKRLGCWCAPKPCHGDVLVKILEELEIEPFNVDELSRKLSVSAAELGVELSMLEMKGAIEQEEGKYRLKK